MTNLNKFAAQQLTKKQMNEVKGGELSDCYLTRPGERPQLIFLESEEYDEYKAQTEASNREPVC